MAEREIGRYREVGGGEATAAFAEGLLFAQASRHAEALARYEFAIRLRPRWTHAHREAGLMALRLGRWNDLERHANALRATLPLDSATLRILGALRRGRWRAAFRAFRDLPRSSDKRAGGQDPE